MTQVKKSVLKNKAKTLKKNRSVLSTVCKKIRNFPASYRKSSKTRKLTLSIGLAIILATIFVSRSLFVVAFINGVPISRWQYIKNMEKLAGKQVFESMLIKTLINQEANSKNINIPQQDVDIEIKNISDSLKSQGTSLEDTLGMQNQTMDDLKDNIKIQKTIEALLTEKVSVSDSEAKQYFDTNKQYFGEDAEFDTVKEDIFTQLKRQKLTTEFESYIETLKNESSIIYSPGYKFN